MNIKKIIVSGGWSYGNVGDEAIAVVTINLLKKYFPECKIVFLAYDTQTFFQHHNVKAYSSAHKLLEQRKVDSPEKYSALLQCSDDLSDLVEYQGRFDKETLFVMSGGGYFNEVWSESFYAHLFELYVAQKCGSKVAIISQSIGPIKTDGGKRLLRDYLLHVDYLSVRDKQSYHYLKTISNDIPVTLTADLVNIISDIKEKEKRSNSIAVIATYAPNYQTVNCVSESFFSKNPIIERVGKKIRFISYRNEFVRLVEWLENNTTLKIKFISSTDYEWDHDFVEFVTSKIPKERFEIQWNLNVNELYSMISSCDYLISTKMHPVIIASSFGIPAYAISYNYKLDDYMESIGRSRCCIRNIEFKLKNAIEVIGKDIKSGEFINVDEQKESIYHMFDSIKKIVE